MTTISIEDQIACVRREIAMRQRVYPRRVGAMKMTQANADREMKAMIAILATLQRVRDDGLPETCE